MTIEISLIDLVFRGIAGVCTIATFILIIREQKKTAKFLKEKLAEPDNEEDELPQGEWVKMKDIQDVMAPMLRSFYNSDDEDIECILQEIKQKAYLIHNK